MEVDSKYSSKLTLETKCQLFAHFVANREYRRSLRNDFSLLYHLDIHLDTIPPVRKNLRELMRHAAPTPSRQNLMREARSTAPFLDERNHEESGLAD